MSLERKTQNDVSITPWRLTGYRLGPVSPAPSGPTRSHICGWLRVARDDAKLSRRAVSHAIGVTERAIQSWEDENDTPLPPADKFLALVKLYRAEKKLLVLLGNWERFKGGDADAGGRRSKAAGE